MSKKDFLEWLRTHPHITLARLEESCELYPGTLKKALKNERLLPVKHLAKLIEEIEKYGYKNKKKQ